jgi:hypothetical protein
MCDLELMMSDDDITFSRSVCVVLCVLVQLVKHVIVTFVVVESCFAAFC